MPTQILTLGLPDAVIAIDLETGERAWVNQLLPDVWIMGCDGSDNANCPGDVGPDFDFSASPLLTTSPSGRELLVVPQKSGWLSRLIPTTAGSLSGNTGRGPEVLWEGYGEPPPAMAWPMLPSAATSFQKAAVFTVLISIRAIAPGTPPPGFTLQCRSGLQCHAVSRRDGGAGRRVLGFS